MGSVRGVQRMAEFCHECNVVVVGDCRVGKSALVSRFVCAKFSEVRTESFANHHISVGASSRGEFAYC